MAIRLQDLLRAWPGEIQLVAPEAGVDPLITGLSFDSRATRPGDLFFALPGQRIQGHTFIAEARAAGAAAVVVEGEAPAPEGEGPVVRVRRAREALGLAAALFEGEPSRALRLVGVTGTDGKTSTCWFAQQLLAACGRRAAALGTLGVRLPDGTLEGWGEAQSAAAAGEAARLWQPTTPEAPLFQTTLSRLREAGVTEVVAEVSSHALVQERTFGSQFHAVALTQVTADHLDFHGSREAYLAAKRCLFARETRGGPLEKEPVVEILNLDDPLGRELALERPAALTYGRAAESRIRLLSGVVEAGGLTLEISFEGEVRALHAPVLGPFHLQNLLVAAAIARALGLSPEEIAGAAATLAAVPGRFEAIPTELPLTVIVDYAHTPVALEGLLGAARALGTGRLTVVFGCGGDRDATKREPMGEAAGRLADRVIVTDDNPRSENPEQIAAAVLRGVRRVAGSGERIAGRRRALAHAIASARPGEILVVAGRGAETQQIFADRVVAFDDREVVRMLLHRRSQGPILPRPEEDPWSLGAVARMTRATVAGISPEDWKLVSPLAAAGASLDSRGLVGGEIFVALAGERVDGHQFIEPALEAGAAAVVARRAWWSRRKAARARGIHLLVDDPVEALQQWAAGLRLALAPKVIAITGSAGKTTTKELALALLSREGRVLGTPGNRNNEIGLPWTLLQLRQGDAYAVLEMGANHPGEIGRLAKIARPDVAVITGIGRAHLGSFGGPEALLAAKLEILEGLSPEGTLVVPAGDERIARALAGWGGRVVRFGFDAGAEIAAERIEASLDGTRLWLRGASEPVRLRMLGPAAARSALAAIAAVQALGVDAPAWEALADVPPFPGRMDAVGHQGATWLLDMYNAAPESVLHALGFLRDLEPRGRRIFIFGGMRELGEESEAIHQEIGRAAGFCDAALFVGEEARLSAPDAQRAGARQVLWSPDTVDAVRFLREYLRPGDVVLLKGARAAALEKIATELEVIPATYGEGRL